MPKKNKIEAVEIEVDPKWDYEALMKAGEIKKNPKRMKAISKHHKKYKKDIKSLDDLMKVRYEENDDSREDMED